MGDRHQRETGLGQNVADDQVDQVDGQPGRVRFPPRGLPRISTGLDNLETVTFRIQVHPLNNFRPPCRNAGAGGYVPPGETPVSRVSPKPKKNLRRR